MKSILREFLTEFVFFLSLLISMILLKDKELLLAALYYFALLSFQDKYFMASETIFGVTCAVLFSLGELILVRFGLWKYYSESLLGIPIWLPFLWGLTSILLIKMYKTVEKVKFNR